MHKMRVGVIGTGFIGPAHIEALRRLPNVEVVALADKDDETANAKADQLGIAARYGDYKKLLANEGITSVHICTPNNFHYTMAKEALLAGKNVMCEKPLATTVAEAKELVELGKPERYLDRTAGRKQPAHDEGSLPRVSREP
jgi:predicted dehydrogenase